MSNPTILVQYGITVEIGTVKNGSVWTYSSLNAGWDNLTEALNEIMVQWFPASYLGFAANHVTGMAPAYTLTGKRVIGDAAQEYIFGKKYSLGSNRESSLRITRLNASGTSNVITCDCTFCNLVEYAGASTDGAAISMELRLNGTPVSSATLPELTVVSYAGTTGKTLIYVNPALTGTNTYVYITDTTVTLPAAGETCASPTYTAWNGVAEIAATNGNEIAIIEVTTAGAAVKGGIATVTAG